MDKYVNKNVSKKGKVPASERARQYKGQCHHDGGVLFCSTCNCALDHTRKSTVDQHLKSKNHLARLEVRSKKAQSESDPGEGPSNPKKQKTITTLFKATTIAQTEKIKVCHDWVKALASSNIPLSKTDNPALRTFLNTRVKNGGAIPSGRQLQSSYLFDVYEIQKEELKNKLSGHRVGLIFDEMSDNEGRYVLNILIAPVDEKDENGRIISYLGTTTFLEKTNHSTVSQAVIKCVQDYSIDFENVVVIDTDGAAYMRKAYRDVLKALFVNAIHVTCLAHMVNLIGESFRKPFNELNNFVRSFSAVFYMAGARKGRYIAYLKSVQPDKKPTVAPNPCATRWNSWYFAVQYHQDHFSHYPRFFEEELENSGRSPCTSLVSLNAMLLNRQMFLNLEGQINFIACQSKPIISLMNCFEGRKPCTPYAFEKMEELKILLDCGVTCTVESCVEYFHEDMTLADKKCCVSIIKDAFSSASEKLDKYLGDGQPALEFLKACRLFNPIRIGSKTISIQQEDYNAIPGISEIPESEFRLYTDVIAPETNQASFSGNICIDDFWNSIQDRVPNLEGVAKSYRNCIVNSADAERSFSLYNVLLSSRRRSLSEKSIAALMFVYYNFGSQIRESERVGECDDTPNMEDESESDMIQQEIEMNTRDI